jgi:hypothetical protein
VAKTVPLMRSLKVDRIEDVRYPASRKHKDDNRPSMVFEEFPPAYTLIDLYEDLSINI